MLTSTHRTGFAHKTCPFVHALWTGLGGAWYATPVFTLQRLIPQPEPVHFIRFWILLHHTKLGKAKHRRAANSTSATQTAAVSKNTH